MLDTVNEVHFLVTVRVTAPGQEEFTLTFAFSGSGPDQDVMIRCSRDLSDSDGERLENLVTNFVGDIADVIFKVQ
jgi:hypothetical protein